MLLLEHAGRMIWRAPHDREPIWLSCWYRLDCFDHGGEFDVRELPNFTECPVRSPRGADWSVANFVARENAEQQHHAEIIRAALDAGHEPLTVKTAS